MQVERDAALAELASIDAEFDQLSARRIEVLDELERLRDRLWPETPSCRGRRPPSLDRSPMPPIPVGARAAWGRGLRGLCLAILGRHGELGLPDLHALIHRYGYRVDSDHPVKALGDALAYEVRMGRAMRVQRGVYDLVDTGRRDGYRTSPSPGGDASPLGDLLDWSDVPVDPAERTDPDRWIPGAWPDPPAEQATSADDPEPPTEPMDPPPARTSPPPPLSGSVGTDSAQIRPRRDEQRATVERAGDGRADRPGGSRQEYVSDPRRSHRVDSVRPDEGTSQFHRPTDPP